MASERHSRSSVGALAVSVARSPPRSACRLPWSPEGRFASLRDRPAADPSPDRRQPDGAGCGKHRGSIEGDACQPDHHAEAGLVRRGCASRKCSRAPWSGLAGNGDRQRLGRASVRQPRARPLRSSRLRLPRSARGEDHRLKRITGRWPYSARRPPMPKAPGHRSRRKVVYDSNAQDCSGRRASRAAVRHNRLNSSDALTLRAEPT
jgi:hypothetical protein